MSDGIALTELAVGGGAGIAATLTAAALFFRRKTVAMDEEKVRLDDEHKAKLEQQSTEHAARLEVLAAERDKAASGAASGAATDATLIAKLVTETVEKLLPEAVAKVQAIERARVAHDRAREQALAETIKAALKEMQEEK